MRIQGGGDSGGRMNNGSNGACRSKRSIDGDGGGRGIDYWNSSGGGRSWLNNLRRNNRGSGRCFSHLETDWRIGGKP